MALEELVIEVLRPTVWKSVLEIIEDIVKLKYPNEPPSALERLAEGVRIPVVHIKLEELEREGLVSRRDRALTPEQLSLRRGRAKPEFALTQDGVRRRHETRSAKHETPDGLPSEV